FKTYFPHEVLDKIIKGNLSVEDIDVVSQNAVAKANNLENQTGYLHNQIKRTELFGDDVHLQQLSNCHRPMMARSCWMKSIWGCDGCCDVTSTIQVEEELVVLYWYLIDEAFLLS
ncbi:unnamed protein product, partial [Rotaria sp. Silwood2]